VNSAVPVYCDLGLKSQDPISALCSNDSTKQYRFANEETKDKRWLLPLHRREA
jgi:hypothetical protein